MTNGDTEILVIGGGAAGIAAARRLADRGIRCLLVEARPRLGGRAWTAEHAGYPLDLGCGWLHSADRNPWTGIVAGLGFSIDKTPPPWARSAPIGFPPAEQAAFRKALGAFHGRLARTEDTALDRPAATDLEPGNHWNGLLNAITTYLSGTEAEKLSAVDFARYDDSGVNWRVIEGYGTAITACAAGLPALLDCPVQRVDHGGKTLRAETAKGTLSADGIIVAVPSSLIAEGGIAFSPTLPRKVDAAAALPLGLADKLFLSLEHAEEFESDTRLFAHTDRAATASYHLRPFGRPTIEAYFGGQLAEDLEVAGPRAFFDFALSELTSLLGSDFARRIAPIAATRWRADPFARGSYSYAVPGRSDERAILAAPVDDRIFFAGEACSRDNFSTAHGAYLTGIAAADQAIAALKR